MEHEDTARIRAAIRLEMRSRRAALGDDDLAAVAMAVLTRLARLVPVREARVVAGYRAVRGEVEVDAALAFLAEHGATVTTPRVRGDRLEFVVTDDETPTTVGSFGIPEPVGDEVVAVDLHDVLLVPLVAFDARGCRLGQGGGFYDRALSTVAGRRIPDRPVLIGVAHAFQQIEAVPSEEWDVPLDAIVTEEGVVEVTRGAAGHRG